MQCSLSKSAITCRCSRNRKQSVIKTQKPTAVFFNRGSAEPKGSLRQWHPRVPPSQIEKREVNILWSLDAFCGLWMHPKCICGLGSAQNPVRELTALPQTSAFQFAKNNFDLILFDSHQKTDSNRFNSAGLHPTVEWWKVGEGREQIDVLTLIFPAFVPAAVA